MKPDWDKLMKENKGNPSSLIADVDCTAAGEPLCQKYGVKGYPTLKYGSPDKLQDYQGGRDLASLKNFAENNLGPKCGAENLKLCKGKQKELYDKYMEVEEKELEAKRREIRKEVKEKEEEIKVMSDVGRYKRKLDREKKAAEKKKAKEEAKKKKTEL